MSNHRKEDQYLDLCRQHDETEKEIIELEGRLELIEEEIEEIRANYHLDQVYLSAVMEVI